MKSRISQAMAALLVAAAASTANSQATVTPAAETQVPPAYVKEPVASVSKTDDVANAIAQAIGADASMQGSKITVQPEDTLVLLTGVTVTEAQRLKATQLATALAGGKPVVNAISASEVVIQVPDPQPVASEVDAQAEPASAATQPQTPPQPEGTSQPQIPIPPKE